MVRTLLILLLIYMVYRTFMKYVLPEVLRDFVTNAQQKANYARQQQHKPDNKTHIDVNPAKNNLHIDGGEYVDYEEIK